MSMSTPATSPRRLFAVEVARPEQDLNLARAALLVAKEEYPQLSVELYLARLDQMAEEVKDRLADETAPLVVLDELVRTLFERRRLRGNRTAYYDPRNSFLNDVLDRGVGIPLTLGIVLLEVAWRLHLPMEGVNFPSHFLVRYRGDAMHLLLDPFDGGRVRFEDQAQELLDQVYGGMVRVQDQFMRRATRRDMLARLLVNLKGVYVNVGDPVRALAVVERLLLIQPTARGENRDRGLLLARMGRRDEAAEQLEAYLELAPEAPDAERIRDIVGDLRAGRSLSDDDMDGEEGA
jgi:regulator of sirC expression with transglutaminase-like and TPR domain